MPDNAPASASAKRTKYTPPLLTDCPWWTAADRAELSLVTFELVNALWDHRDRCQKCRDRMFCTPSNALVRSVLQWREGRILHSQAVWLRAAQDATEDAANAADKVPA